jgi:hypothetical protein
MSKVKFYATKEAAEAEAKEFVGYRKVEVVQGFDRDEMDEEILAWCIKTEKGYYRVDGYVN